MNLLKKLDSINIPKIESLKNGTAKSIEELWDSLIKKYLPKKECVIAWHDLLMEYISSDNPVFAIRGFNSFSKNQYDKLRRGFLTKLEDFSFFYTDNFFAAYFSKMAIDNYVPTFNEFYNAFKTRAFPSRFGKVTKEERELLAIKQGKDPRINSAGFKISHIIPVGKQYCFNNTIIDNNEMLNLYFPNGERKDWKKKKDNIGLFYQRDLVSSKFAKKYAIAQFLRFVHPFNYFLCPKNACEVNDKCTEVAEYQPLLNYAHDYNLKLYGERYKQFLDLILVTNEHYKMCYDNTTSSISIEYGLNLNENKIHKENKINNKYSFDIKINMAIEYLYNPKTSFRKLEEKFLNIKSLRNGGGFVSRSIINSLGITAKEKGILSTMSIDSLIEVSHGDLLETLLKIKETQN